MKKQCEVSLAIASKFQPNDLTIDQREALEREHQIWLEEREKQFD